MQSRYLNWLLQTYCVDAHPVPKLLPASVSIPVHNEHPTGITGIALAQNGNNIIAESKPPFGFGKKWGTKNAEFWDFYKNKNRHYKRWFRLGMCTLYNHTRVYYILDAI